MLRRGVKIQLVAFVVISVLAVAYGLVRFAKIDELVDPPYTVRAEFSSFGGIYPDAEVTLLGVRVGQVTGLRPTPDGRVTVDLRIDHGVRIPAAVTAAVASKSAVGEQFVQLTPQRPGGPQLVEGSVIPLSQTAVPLPVENLLADLNALAATLPKEDVATALDELGTAFDGLGPELDRLLENSNDLTKAGLDNLDDLITLIDTSSTVLDTQVDLGGHTTRMAEQLAGLTTALRGLNPDTARLFTNGIRSGEQVTGLLRDNQRAIPALLSNLLTMTDVTLPRLQGLRKTLVVFPYTVEAGMTQLRYCDEYDTRTGKPIAETCHYDPRTGEPIWAQHFAFELGSRPGDPPDAVCVKGYEGTNRYQPNGQPVGSDGPRQQSGSPANLDARCAAAPTDPKTPNVRGSQNAQRHGEVGARTSSGDTSAPTASQRVVVGQDGSANPVLDHIGPPPPSSSDGLGWLMAGWYQKEVN